MEIALPIGQAVEVADRTERVNPHQVEAQVVMAALL
jgi:hypothetical protein